MKITIDTKEDSHEDIMKVMQILSHFQKQESEPVQTANMMSMFNTEEKQTEPIQQETTEEQSQGTPPDFTSFLNLNKDKEEDKGIQFF